MTNIINKEAIDGSNYVNTTTGESLMSEMKGITSVNIKNEKLKIMPDYKEYVVMSSEAREFIHDTFSDVEASRIFKMADMMNDCYNALYNKQNKLHTKETLTVELKYTRDKFTRFMKKMYMSGIIWYLKGVIDGQEVNMILFNPFIAKKRKTIHVDAIASFNDIQKLRNIQESLNTQTIELEDE